MERDCCALLQMIQLRLTSLSTMEEPRLIANPFQSLHFPSSVKRSPAPIVHLIDPNLFC